MDLVFAEPLLPETPLRAAIRDAHRLDEAAADARIIAAAQLPPDAGDRIAATARRLVAGIHAVLARGRRADVPRRSLAAHPRFRHGRPPDPRQDRRRRLATSSRPFRLAVRQRLDLGLDADRAPAAARPRWAGGRRRSRHHFAPLCRAIERAGVAAGGDRGDAHPGRPVHHGADDRGGAGAGRERRAAGLPAFLRHARRGGPHRA